MIRPGAACVFITLTICACGKERPDPRLAELTTPVHITVRGIDAPVEKTCTGTTTEQLTCMVSRAERRGCVYVEVGATADKPQLSKTPDAARCYAIETTPDLAVLSEQPGRKARLSVDPSGSRVAIELADGLHVIYLRDGHLAIQRKVETLVAGTPSALLHPDGTVDWPRIPVFLEVLDEAQLRALTEPQLDALVAETPGGKAALKSSLVALMDSADVTDQAFTRAVAKLDVADRADMRRRLLREVSEGNAGALGWFDAHPEEQDAAFVTALGDSAENSGFDVGTVLPRLLRLAPQRAEEIACDDLERKWHEATTAPYDFSNESPLEAAALAVIISRRSKCPWVVPLLLRQPCAWELRCDPDLEDRKPTGLCTDAEVEIMLKRTLHPESETDAEDEDATMDTEQNWGPLLVAAAKVQGPLPPEFLRKDERRLYTQIFKSTESDDTCRQLIMEPSDWACHLPREITTAFTEGCTVVIDDAKKTMTLSSPEPEPQLEAGD